MSALLNLAKSLSFSKGSKMETVLKSDKPTDKQIADAALKTKAYKENAEFKAAVDAVLKPAPASEPRAEKPEAKKATTSRGGEHR